jgi:hypothetical protein
MKIYEMIAINPQGVKIVQRVIDNIRYIKAVPPMFMPIMFEKTKQSLGQFCNVTENDKGWIVIERKTDFLTSEMKEKMSSDLRIPVNSSPIDIVNKEAELFKQQGFRVEVKEYETQ